MKVVVITDDKLKDELVAWPMTSDVVFTKSLEEAIKIESADAIIDLLFEKDGDRIKKLSSCLPALIIINCVEYTSAEIHSSFVRINGWPTLLNSSLVEATAPAGQQLTAEKIFKDFNKEILWTKDIPGFISARIIACIIREANYAFAEGISSKEDIDLAMKLGTSYPFGPFEWCEKIGQKRIDSLLNRLT
jgi:3-hydroxybutyryl-CoA dehydrogenase